ncbi:protein serine/threonine kinase, putative [Entamoeba invadens IP1]|uniref:Protein serine/threonine kinase, putative n=1 Tax=Entamoeba invadens IP1 TaxID=370355 RepID=L7FNV8_ENTIV|nr:protein serine/threonine kinase, putative [Entamoeba invadens IP1]ELP89083.1 protein serine/threonine kinase, putative [Entamoeba invadens IP1]|eukprot:XP_004255854.1 protein serine/threonine kinase, putative [Entamoeba invadens IP1]
MLFFLVILTAVLSFASTEPSFCIDLDLVIHCYSLSNYAKVSDFCLHHSLRYENQTLFIGLQNLTKLECSEVTFINIELDDSVDFFEVFLQNATVTFQSKNVRYENVSHKVFVFSDAVTVPSDYSYISIINSSSNTIKSTLKGAGCTVANCYSCSSSSLSTCTACYYKYYLENNICKLCGVINCYRCTSSTTCTECIYGYYLSSLTCKKCTTSNCYRCDNSNICLECLYGYYKDSTNNCVPCSRTLSSCYRCSSSTTCDVCYYGSYMNNGVCTTCPVITNNCYSCSSATTCSRCYYGYYLTSSTNTCNACSSTLSYCDRCYNQTTCTQCKPGYYLSSGTCSSCGVTNCYTCQSSTTCKTCYSGYYINNNVCTPCTDTNCMVCPTEDRCSKCKSYHYSKDDKCIKCDSTISYCNDCYYNEISSKAICTTCKRGTYISNGICLNCTSLVGCSDCLISGPTCTVCKGGYYLSNEKCNVCSTGCTTCTSNTACSKCAAGYYLDGTSCTICSPTCAKCNSVSGVCTSCATGLVYDSPKSKVCVTCTTFDAHCTSCPTESRVCAQCATNYYPKGGVCAQCSTTCLTNNCSTTTGICLHCSSGYVPYTSNSVSCELCSTFNSYCQTCSQTERKCVACKSGSYLSGTSCVTCHSTCASTCSTTTGICFSCISGYVLSSTSSNQCELCESFDANCLTCASDSSRKCIACKTDYYINSAYTCTHCDSSCSSCEPNGGICKVCKADFVMKNPPGIACTGCSDLDPNCLKCAADSSGSCITCKGGYYPSKTTGNCIPCDLTCKSDACNAMTGICTSCQSNYVFKSNKDVSCDSCNTFDAHCSTCASDFSRKCIVCRSNYYPVYSSSTLETTCKACDLTCNGNCDTTNGVCRSCISNYVFIAGGGGTSCEKCSSFDANCLTCSTTFNRICTTCNIGYYPSPNTGACMTCSATCQTNTCNTSTGKCDKCATNYVVTSPLSTACMTCKSFDSNCKTCSSTFERKCVQCESGYYPTSNGLCTHCSTNCSSCNPTTGICELCNSNYVFEDPKSVNCTSCSDFDKNCKTCDSASNRKCSICTSNYFKTTSGDFKCRKCDDSCGGSCDGATGYCTSCLSNFVFNAQNRSKCDPCYVAIANCSACALDHSRICKTCSYGSYPSPIDGLSCVLCDQTCQATYCDTTNGTCIRCKSDYVYKNPHTYSCELCSVFDPNCLVCSSVSQRKCYECKTNYAPVYAASGDLKCSQCDATCGGNCNTTNGQCERCLENYIPTEPISKVCESCSTVFPNCVKCPIDERKCLQCSVGYYPEDSTSVCKSCDQTCNSQCDSITGNCNECLTNYVFTSPKSRVCVKCSEIDIHCKMCSRDYARKCYECNEGYYPHPESGICQSCGANCVKCNPLNGNCISCSTNAVISASDLKVCELCSTYDANCMTCSSTFERKCIACKPNYYPNASGKCGVCSTTCGGQCDTKNGVCTACESNKVFTEIPSTQCVACNTFDTNCVTCAASFERKCVTCMTGKYPKLDGKCYECDLTCNAKCNTQTGQCTACKENYVFNTNNKLICTACAEAISNCQTCASDYSKTCVGCKSGYHLVSNTCVLCNSTCNGNCDGLTGKCLSCSSNSVFSEDKMSCVECNTFNSDCVQCSPTYERKCITCTNGMYAKDGVCVSCPTTCINCDGSNGECIECQSNYVKPSEGGQGCEACSSFDPNCVTCASNAERKCSVCTSNYFKTTSGDFKCRKCDDSCGGSCDGNNGNCLKCASNYVLKETASPTCEACRTFDTHCKTCDSKFVRKCQICDLGFYPSKTTGKCISCDLSCSSTSCNTSSGICSTCASNYVFKNPKEIACESCTSFDANCATCATDYSRKCIQCRSNYYPKTVGDFRCQQCDSTCGGNCNTVNGYCLSCQSGYVPTLSDPLKCESCQLFDSNCEECIPNKRQCKICKRGMYPDETSKKCVNCDSSCDSMCSTTSGVCEGCKSNFVFNDPKTKTCQNCSSFDANCETCSETFSRTCIKCISGFYPNKVTGICNGCDSVAPNCYKCLTTENKCTQCFDPFILKSGTCSLCPTGQYKKDEMTCESCYSKLVNCLECTTPASGSAKCTKCYAPYIPDENGNCRACVEKTETYFYDEINKIGTCKKNEEGCSIQVDKKCMKCNATAFVSNGDCVSTKQCQAPSIKTQSSCDCADQISINSDCATRSDHCKYQKTNKGVVSCINCDDNYTVLDGNCVSNNNDNLNRNGIIFGCQSGEFLNTENVCSSCDLETSCILYKNEIKKLSCGQNEILDISTATCVTDEKCSETLTSGCVKCAEKSNQISEGRCEKCLIEHCDICHGTNCSRCESGFLLTNSKLCSQANEVNCMRTSATSCVECGEGYFVSDDKSEEGNYEFCSSNIKKTENCKFYSSKRSKCLECFNVFQMKDGKCAEKFEESLKTFNKTTSKYNKYNINNKSIKKLEIPQKVGTEEDGCIYRTNKGCQHCQDGYYKNNENCLPCENECKTCYNTTYCTSCTSDFYLDSNGVCQTRGDFNKICNVSLPLSKGCAICNNGYYREGTECLTCDVSCELCTNRDGCLTCADGYFLISSESKLCQLNTTILNCEKVNVYGCEKCISGYYLTNGRCSQCSENCTSCQSYEFCDGCDTPNYVLVNFKCLFYSKVDNCISAEDSKCIKCTGNNKPTTSGDSCLATMNYGVVVGVPISVVLLLVLLIVCVIVTILYILMKRKEKVKMENVCVFRMSRSNIQMTRISDVLLTNKNVLKFDLESDNLIPVDEETRDLICIGNGTKHVLKVQFSVMDGCDFYEIRTVPSLVTLKKDEACEFEIFIKPLCSGNISEAFTVTALNIETGKMYVDKMKMEVDTEQSTKLNYRELIEESKLGEGSFGIVYRGKFRGHEVAIKKMKEMGDGDTGLMLDEFNNEVSMLNKFRSEYIVHFYGAVFIPSKICMVTEFAQYGSLQDLMKHKKESAINIKMKTKILLDATKGIVYLHENGILHRDIKPDNILIFTLEFDAKVNGKLTDFGSSRNINMMMTNMTFTKGIGTPAYMPPEVLKQEKYKKSADVYAFAITMYEVFGWKEAFGKETFRYPWKIAEFVTSGKHLEKKENMTKEQYELIDKCWKTRESERIEATEIVTGLTTLFNSNLI